jgi:signal peptidase I
MSTSSWSAHKPYGRGSARARNALTLRRLSALLALVLLLSAAVLWFLLLRPAVLGGPASYIIVSGDSMRPNLQTGDIAVLHKERAYTTGQVVAFRAEGGMVIHRIVEVDADGRYVMKGDNKTTTDAWLPANDNVAGRLVLRIPHGGDVLLAVRHPLIFGAIVGLLVTVSLQAGQPKHRPAKSADSPIEAATDGEERPKAA